METSRSHSPIQRKATNVGVLQDSVLSYSPLSHPLFSFHFVGVEKILFARRVVVYRGVVQLTSYF